MREFLIDLCMFSQEDCQLLEGNLQLYVNIAGVALAMNFLFNGIEKLLVPYLYKLIMKLVAVYKKLVVPDNAK